MPMIKTPKRQASTGPAARRRSRFFVRDAFFAWDVFFADPVAIESDYQRMARRRAERPAR
jgi:hypothetical protein